MHHPEHYRAIFAFIDGIGLPIREAPLPVPADLEAPRVPPLGGGSILRFPGGDHGGGELAAGLRPRPCEGLLPPLVDDGAPLQPADAGPGIVMRLGVPRRGAAGLGCD